MVDLALSGLSLNEMYVAQEIENRITANYAYNIGRREYYEAHRKVKSLGISVPPQYANLNIAVGWPGLVVDAMDERLNIRGITSPKVDADSLGISDIIEQNELELAWQDSHVEGLIQGLAFETVTLGDVEIGEPEVLITVESATDMSGIWNPRRRSMDAAGSIVRDENGQSVAMTLFLRDQIIKLVKVDKTWVVEERQPHNLGRPPVRRLINRSWTSRQWGRSEITRPIIAATDMAVRTLLGSELARELYGAPTRMLLGADEKYFSSVLGSREKAWNAYMGRFLAMPRDEDDNVPSIEQLQAASPAPYIDLVKLYSQLVAGEAALPPTYLGFVTENPASADQIRAVEARHVKRAERRQVSFGAAHRGALIDAIALRDGTAPSELSSLKVNWYDAATPTKAASADAMTKQIASGLIPPRSRIALEGLGYDERQISQIEADWRREDARTSLQNNLVGQAQQAVQNDPAVANLASRRK